MKQIKCAHCGHIEEVETVADGMACPNCGAKMVGDHVRITDVCVFCGKPIHPHEAEIFCPECGKEYHADCWIDNDGCGTHGCSYQNFLAPMEVPSASASKAGSKSPKVEDTGQRPEISGPATVDNGVVQSSEDGDVFAIPDTPQMTEEAKMDDEAFLNQHLENIRKREQAPEQPKISWQDMMKWKDTPRDTKYDFAGPWYKDPYLFRKAKNYLIFLFGGFMGGAVLGVSLVLLFAIFKYIFTHSGTSWFMICSFFWLGVAAGCCAGVYFAYRTMATLIDN